NAVVVHLYQKTILTDTTYRNWRGTIRSTTPGCSDGSRLLRRLLCLCRSESKRTGFRVWYRQLVNSTGWLYPHKKRQQVRPSRSREYPPCAYVSFVLYHAYGLLYRAKRGYKRVAGYLRRDFLRPAPRGAPPSLNDPPR